MRLLAAITGALLVAPTVAAATPARPAAAHDWTRTVMATPQGGIRMGNPKAKLALVEYGSLTCPHCRHFAETAVKPLLDQYVRTGKLSYEFRSFILNGPDIAATLLARCGGPGHFFPIAEQLYATQPTWTGKVSDLPKDQQDRLNALPESELMLAIAKMTGLIPVGAANGIAPSKAQLCLTDKKATLALAKVRQAGEALGVQGTPTFFLNGKQIAAYDWDSLQPFLRKAGG